LPQYRIAICHGKLKPEDKEASMQQFKRGEADIMIATSVIEVGVDVPNATVMVIESAERFGLSQLHQLRGRVGRGGGQSYCILMTGDKLSKDSRARVEAMCATNDGFQLSELDLKLRGAGDIHGTQQSGDAFELNIANLATDTQIMELTRNDAIEILHSDPMLERRENLPLRALRDRHHKREKIDFSDIS
jgi:ATP-dependent DNA helicase RecG